MIKKILIVDDEPHIVKKVSDWLKAKGFDVIIAYDGEQGLKKAKQTKPDIIISDVMMPNMDGPTMAETLKNESSTRTIPVIFLTSLVNKDTEQAQQNLLGGDYIMAKPFNPAKLLKVINKFLRTR